MTRIIAAVLPDDNATRNQFPMVDGLLDYFPLALAEVARVSVVGNAQHNPGEPLHWARDKSTDHANKILRHLVDRGTSDSAGVRHSARLAWRALAMLQEELERAGGAAGRASQWGDAQPASQAVEDRIAYNLDPGRRHTYSEADSKRDARARDEFVARRSVASCI